MNPAAPVTNAVARVSLAMSPVWRAGAAMPTDNTRTALVRRPYRRPPCAAWSTGFAICNPAFDCARTLTIGCTRGCRTSTRGTRDRPASIRGPGISRRGWRLGAGVGVRHDAGAPRFTPRVLCPRHPGGFRCCQRVSPSCPRPSCSRLRAGAVRRFRIRRLPHHHRRRPPRQHPRPRQTQHRHPHPRRHHHRTHPSPPSPSPWALPLSAIAPSCPMS